MFSSTRPHWEMLQIQRLQTYDQLFVETPSMEWMLAPLDPYGARKQHLFYDAVL
jgi:hypothetical protein